MLLPLGLLLAAALRLASARAEREAAWLLCARLAAPRAPQEASISGTLRRRGRDRPAALVDAVVATAAGPRPFAGAVHLAPALAERVPETDLAVTVTGPFRCAVPRRNPAAVADGLSSLEAPRLFGGARGTVTALPRRAAWRVCFQRRFAAAISAPFAEAPGLRALVRAVWLGDTDGFPPTLVAFYREGGLLPILALSGQHVAVLASLVLVFLRAAVVALARRGLFGDVLGVAYRELRRALPLLVAGLLTLTSCETPSMLRTLAMAAALFALRLRRLECSPLQLATSSVACAIVLFPELAARPGFLLSAACTGLLLRLVDEESLRGKLRAYLFLGVAMSLLAIPLTAFFFGRLSLAAPFLHVLLGWLWALVLMPAGFFLPAVAPLLPASLPRLEAAWTRLVAMHQYGASVVESGYVPTAVPTWGEGVVLEAFLLVFLLAVARRIPVRRPLPFGR